MTNSVSFATIILRSGFLWMILALCVPGAQAQAYTVLHTFIGLDGYNPQAGVTLDAAGNLYGTTNRGGLLNCAGGSGCGTVFKLTHHADGWVLTTLHAFRAGSDGAFPEAAVVFGPDGTLYGTTDNGGTYGRGTVFNLRPPANFCGSINCPWTETVLYRFTGGVDGSVPREGSLVFDQQGNIYGTTEGGGIYGLGTVFELTRSGGGWTESVIYNFGTDINVECAPIGGVIFDRAGNLWGTTAGCNNLEYEFGAVFELSKTGSSWTATLIHKFQDTLLGNTPDGGFPLASLTLDSSGNFYGTTEQGPLDPDCPDLGTVFEVNAAGEFSTLHFFPSGSGPNCTGEVGLDGPISLDAQGNLYGTQYGYGAYGAVFKGGPAGWLELTLFDGLTGGLPIGGVAIDANGNLYGTASTDGGGVWEITP